MRFVHLARPLAVLALLLPFALAAIGQVQTTLMDMLNGKSLPLTMKVSELPVEYKAVKLKFQGGGDLSDLMSGPMMLGFAMSGGGGGAESAMFELLDALGASWTKGEWARVGEQGYLITYKADLGAGQLMRMGRPEGRGQEVELQLHLIRNDTITAINPIASLTKERLTALITGGAEQAGKPSDAQIAAKKTATISNAKQQALGMLMYMGDWDDVMPYAQGTRAVQYVTMPYVKNNDVFKTLNPNGGEFRFNIALGGVGAMDVEMPAEMPLFYESLQWPDGTRVVAFLDGHVKAVGPEAWAAMQKYLTMKLKKTAKRPLPLNYGMDWSPGGAGTKLGGPPP